MRWAAAVVIAFSLGASAQLAPSHQPTQRPVSPHGQMTVTQLGNPHGTSNSKLKEFAVACGLPEISEKNVRVFAASNKSWSEVKAEDLAQGQAAIARVWRDAAGKPRVVSVSESLSAKGDTLRVSHICFSPRGKIRNISEHYVNLPACDCGRDTEIAYEEGQGKQTKQTQSWYKIRTRAKLEPDRVPKDAPPVTVYHSVSELPFANLLKEKNASSR